MDTQNGMPGPAPMPTSTPAPAPVSTPSPMMESPKKSSFGPVVSLIVILAIIILGSLYFWQKRDAQEMSPATNTETNTTSTSNETETDTQTQELQTQSSSDDIDSIEADLNATNVSNIDSGVE